MQDKHHDHALPEAGEPANPSRRKIFQAAAAVGLSTALPAASEAAPAAHKAARAARGSLDAKLREHVKNVVVIYLENRGFDHLYGTFPGANGVAEAKDFGFGSPTGVDLPGEAAGRIADRIAIIMDGRIRAVGTPADFARPADPDIANFLNPAIDLANPRFKQLDLYNE